MENDTTETLHKSNIPQGSHRNGVHSSNVVPNTVSYHGGLPYSMAQTASMMFSGHTAVQHGSDPATRFIPHMMHSVQQRSAHLFQGRQMPPSVPQIQTSDSRDVIVENMKISTQPVQREFKVEPESPEAEQPNAEVTATQNQIDAGSSRTEEQDDSGSDSSSSSSDSDSDDDSDSSDDPDHEEDTHPNSNSHTNPDSQPNPDSPNPESHPKPDSHLNQDSHPNPDRHPNPPCQPSAYSHLNPGPHQNLGSNQITSLQSNLNVAVSSVPVVLNMSSSSIPSQSHSTNQTVSNNMGQTNSHTETEQSVIKGYDLESEATPTAPAIETKIEVDENDYQHHEVENSVVLNDSNVVPMEINNDIHDRSNDDNAISTNQASEQHPMHQQPSINENLSNTEVVRSKRLPQTNSSIRQRVRPRKREVVPSITAKPVSILGPNPARTLRKRVRKNPKPQPFFDSDSEPEPQKQRSSKRRSLQVKTLRATAMVQNRSKRKQSFPRKAPAPPKPKPYQITLNITVGERWKTVMKHCGFGRRNSDFANHLLNWHTKTAHNHLKKDAVTEYKARLKERGFKRNPTAAAINRESQTMCNCDCICDANNLASKESNSTSDRGTYPLDGDYDGSSLDSALPKTQDSITLSASNPKKRWSQRVRAMQSSPLKKRKWDEDNFKASSSEELPSDFDSSDFDEEYVVCSQLKRKKSVSKPQAAPPKTQEAPTKTQTSPSKTQSPPNKSQTVLPKQQTIPPNPQVPSPAPPPEPKIRKRSLNKAKTKKTVKKVPKLIISTKNLKTPEIKKEKSDDVFVYAQPDDQDPVDNEEPIENESPAADHSSDEDFALSGPEHVSDEDIPSEEDFHENISDDENISVEKHVSKGPTKMSRRLLSTPDETEKEDDGTVKTTRPRGRPRKDPATKAAKVATPRKPRTSLSEDKKPIRKQKNSTKAADQPKKRFKKIRDTAWSEFHKTFYCKICPYESFILKDTVCHLVKKHEDVAGELIKHLKTVEHVTDNGDALTLYDIVYDVLDDDEEEEPEKEMNQNDIHSSIPLDNTMQQFSEMVIPGVTQSSQSYVPSTSSIPHFAALSSAIHNTSTVSQLPPFPMFPPMHQMHHLYGMSAGTLQQHDDGDLASGKDSMGGMNERGAIPLIAHSGSYATHDLALLNTAAMLMSGQNQQHEHSLHGLHHGHPTANDIHNQVPVSDGNNHFNNSNILQQEAEKVLQTSTPHVQTPVNVAHDTDHVNNNTEKNITANDEIMENSKKKKVPTATLR